MNAKAFSVQQTPDGGYVICGNQINGSSRSAFLLKTDPEGETKWVKSFEGDIASNDQVFLQTKDSGFILCTNIYNDTLAFYRLNNLGEIVRITKSHLPVSAYATCIGYTSDSSLILTGWSYISQETILVKTDKDGGLLWMKGYRIADPYGSLLLFASEGISVFETEDGGFLVSGNCDYDTWYFNFEDSFWLKTNDTGDSLWVKIITSHSGSRYSSFLCNFNSSRNDETSGIIFGAGTIIQDLIGPIKTYGFLVKSNADGDTLWSAALGTDLTKFNSVYPVMPYGILLGGYSSDSGSVNGLLLKTNDQGSLIWQRKFSFDSLQSFATSVYPANDGGIVLCGYTYAPTTYEYVPFIIKTDRDGYVYPQGIDDKHPTTSLSPFPNPTKGMAFLNPPGNFRELEVSDILGNVILRKKIDPNDNSTLKIDLSGNPDGIYLLKLKNENGVRTGKIVIAK